MRRRACNWTFPAVVCNHLGATLTADRFVYAAHWITPAGLSKRFDTRLFVVAAPEGQAVLTAETKLADHCRLTPAVALAGDKALRMMPPYPPTPGVPGGLLSRGGLTHFSALSRIPAVLSWRVLGVGGLLSVMPCMYSRMASIMDPVTPQISAQAIAAAASMPRGPELCARSPGSRRATPACQDTTQG